MASTQQIDEWVGQYGRGMSVRSIAQSSGVSHQTVINNLKAREIDLRGHRQGGNKSEAQDMHEAHFAAHLRQNGQTLQQIAKRLGVGFTATNRRLERAGMPSTRQVTESDVRAWKAAREAGATITSMAKAYGRSEATIAKHLRLDEAVPRPRLGRPQGGARQPSSYSAVQAPAAVII